MTEEDSRIAFLFKQVIAAFPSVPNDKFKEFWYSGVTQKEVISFLNLDEQMTLFVKETSKNVLEIVDQPSPISTFYVIKLRNGSISHENIQSEVIYGDLASDPVCQLSSLAENVYMPLFNSSTIQMISETISKDMSRNFENFLSVLQIAEGNLQGTTRLPFPPSSLSMLKELSDAQNHQSKAKNNVVSRIHDLESIIIIWTKQIKSVLRLDSDDVFKIDDNTSGPLAEVDFWISKSKNLNEIFNQLQKPNVRRIVHILEMYKSTYNGPFIKLCKEVAKARIEANDNLKYLRHLSTYLTSLENETYFESISNHFHPIFRVLLMITKSSMYYNTPGNLSIMLRLLGNTLIRQSMEYLIGENISSAIFDLQQDAIRALETTIGIINNYKNIFLQYREKSVAIAGLGLNGSNIEPAVEPLSPSGHSWMQIPINAIFCKIDQFLNRCHDLLDLTRTIQQLSKLSKIEVGGTKGKSMTSSVMQLSVEVGTLIDNIRAINENMLSYENKIFDDVYYVFCNQIKELDKRLSSVILQAFDDASTVMGKFRVLETFDSLIHRSIVSDAIKKRYGYVIEAIRNDFTEVEKIFIAYKDNIPIPNNLPPISGALTWSRGLLERIQSPIEKIKVLDIGLLDRDEAIDLLKMYASIKLTLSDFDQERIVAWGNSIELSSQTKLKNPLLRREFPDDKSNSQQSPISAMPTRTGTAFNFHSNTLIPSILRVNFDPLLVRLLREVKYFLLLGLQVPSSAMEIYQLVEVYRQYTGNLELIVNMYNDIQLSLLPVERPLIKSQLDHIDRTLVYGIGDSRATKTVKDPNINLLSSGQTSLKTLNWKSNTIESFIAEAMTEVRETTDILQTFKGCLHRIEQIVDSWKTQPIFERTNKTITVDEFYQYQQKNRQIKLTQYKESGHEIHRLLKETNKKLKISQNVADWKAYVDFINNFVTDGLIEAAAASLQYLGNQMNPKRIDMESVTPLLEIHLDLTSSGVTFIPEINNASTSKELNSSIAMISSKSDKNLHYDYVDENGKSSGSKSASSGYFMNKPSLVSTSVTKFRGIREVIHAIISGMLSVSHVFKRIDTTEGSYVFEVNESPEIKTKRSKIFQYVDITEKKCQALRLQFCNYEFLWSDDSEKMFQDFLNIAVKEEKVPFIVETNDNQMTSQQVLSSNLSNNRSSLTNSSQNVVNSSQSSETANEKVINGYWMKTTLNNAMFDERITYYSSLLTEVSELRSSYDIDFLRVNSQPLKQAIFTCVTKRLYSFTSYLQTYITNRLNSIYTLIRDINKGLDQTTDSNDRDAMMSVMTFIRDVRKHIPEMSSVIEPLKSIVLLLKVKNIPLDLPMIGNQPALDFLEQAAMQWDNTVNKAHRVKESIQQLQSAMVESIKKDVKLFDTNVLKYFKDFLANGPFNWLDYHRSKEAYQSIAKYQIQLVSYQEKGKAINELQDLFDLPMSIHQHLADFLSTLQLLKNVWDVVYLSESIFASWKNTLWSDIKADDLIDEVKSIEKLMKSFPKLSKDWLVFKKLESNIMNMIKMLPLINDLHSNAIRERHWKQLLIAIQPSSRNGLGALSKQSSINNFPVEPLSKLSNNQSTNVSSSSLLVNGSLIVVTTKGPLLTFDDILKLNLQNYSDIVSDIVELAQKELKIEMKLNQIETQWNQYQLTFHRHRDTDIFIITSPDEILEAMEENQLQLQSMANMGKYVDYFHDRVFKWQTLLGEIENTLKLLLQVERQWGSLESIFLGSADIRAQLPEDTKRFETVDNEFKEIMKDIQNRPDVMKSCTLESRESLLRNMFKELEKCEKALNEYLEIKKNAFPRFFFVSNASLLDILSNGNNPMKITPHLGSIFDGISDLELCLSPGQLKIQNDEVDSETMSSNNQLIPSAAKSMISKDNEIIVFNKLFEMKNNVESWLHDLIRAMQGTLRYILSQSLATTNSWNEEGGREEWIFTVPAQIGVLTSQIIWTDDVETALEEIESGQDEALKKYSELCIVRLEGMIKLVQNPLSKEDRVKIITVITSDVHNRDIAKGLVKKKVESSSDFNWQSQLRYYWLAADKHVNVRICDFITSYSFEYIGNCGRLVITPLTDRCYVTLATALRLNLGGAPSGPAGTGKTETTKDLARGLGLPCYVFNCSDQMNYQTIGDVFKGLAQVGAWGCFDEFNRIDIEVLSVVATQVRCILEAITFFSIPSNRTQQYQSLPPGTPPTKVGVFNFFDEQISLVPTVGIFITMNPGYAGRTELPENLKLHFRSCAMVQPDVLPICENMLMAEGFIGAHQLAVKFVTLYKLSSELLSKQHHYDWGLRAIKSVLKIAGVLKRADPEFPEEAILMRALRDFNTPKIPNNDIPVFLRLISDLFPGLDMAPKLNVSLRDTCIEVCKSQGWQSDDTFTSKVLQYQELLDIRHSVMILGPPGCGKTTIWKTVVYCHNHRKSKPITVYDIINPKAITTDELYGYMTLTKDWKDGALSIVMRNMSTNVSPYSSTQTSKWVVLDGDVDAVWIESMNSVMDDNKVLTLVSNERISLNDSMRMIFEVHTLQNATPATVSRAGILYINDSDIGYEPYIDSWLLSRGETEKSMLSDIFDRYLHKVVDFFQSSKLETIVKLPLINIVQSLCYLLDGTLSNYHGEKSFVAVERIFVYCLMWSFGGTLSPDKQSTNDSRKIFNLFYRNLVKSIKFPDQGLVFDYHIDPATGEVSSWQQKSNNIPNSLVLSRTNAIFVPTAETLRLTNLMDIMVRINRPIMFVGSTGTGKTYLVQDYLNSLTSSSDGFKFTTINMNYYTDSYSFQHQLEQHIDKRSGKNFGPSSGKFIYFVDDLNLPEVETYGTQTPIALMRQHIDHKSWFDRSDLSLKKTIVNCQYIACMNHKCGSFQIDPRLQRHFMTVACHMPSDTDLSTIFSAIIRNHFHSYDFDSKIQQLITNLTEASVVILKECSLKFPPSVLKFHYNFTVRDLGNIAKGIINSRPSKEYKQTQTMCRLWYHETMRVLSDKLVMEHEIDKLHDMAVTIGKKYLDEDDKNYSMQCLFSSIPIVDAKEMNSSIGSNPISFPTSSKSGAVKPFDGDSYIPIDDSSLIKRELDRILTHYNETHSIMNLVLFDQAIHHINRIVRILKMNGGNALLVGVGGCGKRSLSRLAAFICGYEIVQLSVTSEFTIEDFLETLRDLHRKAVVKPGSPIVFLLTESQIVDERFLVYINDFLSSGRVNDLFTKEEYDGIFSSIRNLAKSEGIPDTRENMMEFFLSRVKSNLHILLCMSPVGDSLRQRARKFPSIINAMAIDWFHEWKKDALIAVAVKYLEDLDGSQSGQSIASVIKPRMSARPYSKGSDRNKERPPSSGITASTISPSTILRDNLAHHMADVHLSVSEMSEEFFKQEKRHNYTTPKSFLELINLYRSLLSNRKIQMSQSIKRLETGLDTLVRTSQDVMKLQEFLREKKKEVESKKVAADQLLDEMGKQRAEAEAQQTLADIEKNKADEMANQAKALESQAAGDLALAKPVMDAAHEAIDCLDKASMTELRSFTKPPIGVDKVTSVLLIMIKNEKKDFSWDNAKKMMGKLDLFKEKLETYPSEDIPEDIIARVAPYLEDPEFTFDRMKTKSSAAANLTAWVLNTIAYNEVYKRVKPLMDSLDVATKAKKVAEDELVQMKEKLSAIEGKLATLQSQFLAASSDKAKVEQEYKELSDRLSLAERLTNGLSSENDRWQKTVESLRSKELTLPGDMMLAASFVSYIGVFSSSFRRNLWKNIWLQDLIHREVPISNSSTIDPLWLLANDSEIASWQNDSLPADRISLENAAIIKNSSRWPLLIDPQNQGLKWLKYHMKSSMRDSSNDSSKRSSRRLIVLKHDDKKRLQQIIQAIYAGDVVIIENIPEAIDTSLYPLLSKSLYRKGRNNIASNSNPQLYLRIGDEEILYNDSFQLFLQTQLSNPNYSPEIASQCTLINFNVTRTGLEDQLLAMIVSDEEPDLERSRNDLIANLNHYKIQLKDLEDNLLDKLANAPIDILNDIALIEGLEATKLKVNDINDAVKRGNQTEQGINQARDVYRVIASEASIHYFLILQLSSIHSMYQYSLESFLYYFLKSLRTQTIPFQDQIIQSGNSLQSQNMNSGGYPQPAYRAASSTTLNVTTSSSVGSIGSYDMKLGRVKSLQITMRWMLYEWIIKSLFEKHRLLYLTQLVFNLLQVNIIPADMIGFNIYTLHYLLHGIARSSNYDNNVNISPISVKLTSPRSESSQRISGKQSSLGQNDDKSPLSWLSDDIWNQIKILATMESFEKLPSDIIENSTRFLEWFQHSSPETERLPGDLRDIEKYPFKKLLFVRTIRPDRLTAAIQSFIREILPYGKQFIDYDQFNSSQILEQAYMDTSSRIPIFFIVSPGVDITTNMDKLAMKCGKVKGVDYHNISLGQGQDQLATERLDVGQRQGHWIFLNNLHLMPRWLTTLEQKLDDYNSRSVSIERQQSNTLRINTQAMSTSPIHDDEANHSFHSSEYANVNQDQNKAIEQLDINSSESLDIANSDSILVPSSSPTTGNQLSQTHPDFRVFFSSDQSDVIPSSILCRSIKITSDSPSGLKTNLKYAFTSFSKQTYEELEPRSKCIMFSLCYFHSIMIERKKFGTKGFNQNYPFNLSDLHCSMIVLKNYMDSVPSKIPWNDLRYLFGEIMYGGCIINEYDRLTTQTYLEYYMKDEIFDEMLLYPYYDSITHGSQSSNAVTNTAITTNINNMSNPNALGNDTSTGMNGSSYQSTDALSSSTAIDSNLLYFPSMNTTYDQILTYIDESMRYETPLAYGLHPNSEIVYRTVLSDSLLTTLIELSQSSSVAFQSYSINSNESVLNQSNSNDYTNNDSITINTTMIESKVNNHSLFTSETSKDRSFHSSESNIVLAMIQEIHENYHDIKYEIDSIVSNLEDITPLQYFILQESERMMKLINIILTSIYELECGYKGELIMSEAMESLATSLYLNRVPKQWEKYSYPSLKPLNSWFIDLNNRITQLNDWMNNINDFPIVTWISGLFNPISFLTTIIQIYSQSNNIELDKLTITNEITKKLYPEELTTPAKEGAYIYGLYLEGGTWNNALSQLEPSKPKEMYCPLPVLHMKPVVIEQMMQSNQSTGKDSNSSKYYQCPVYRTQHRNNTYMFHIQLRSKYDQGKWILNGVAALMDPTL